jgi:hypothetical protein
MIGIQSGSSLDMGIVVKFSWNRRLSYERLFQETLKEIYKVVDNWKDQNYDFFSET